MTTPRVHILGSRVLALSGLATAATLSAAMLAPMGAEARARPVFEEQHPFALEAQVLERRYRGEDEVTEGDRSGSSGGSSGHGGGSSRVDERSFTSGPSHVSGGVQSATSGPSGDAGSGSAGPRGRSSHKSTRRDDTGDRF